MYTADKRDIYIYTTLYTAALHVVYVDIQLYCYLCIIVITLRLLTGEVGRQVEGTHSDGMGWGGSHRELKSKPRYSSTIQL
jgi:hypothetical protein